MPTKPNIQTQALNLLGIAIALPNLRALSPVTGFAIMWRGKGDNPYPIKADEAKQRGLSSNQMYMCATCEFNKEIYEQYINNSIKK